MVAQYPASAVRPGICRMIVAVLILAARLLGTAPDADATPAGVPGLDGLALCGSSSAPAGQHAPPLPKHHHDCLLCPACCLAGLAVLPVADHAVPSPALAAILGHAALPPPATGPPHAARIATPPTGPPAYPI